MTRDDLIRMAREAGLLPDNTHPTPETRHMRQKAEAMQRFAALVAGVEREACAKLCDNIENRDGDSAGLARECADAIRSRKG